MRDKTRQKKEPKMEPWEKHMLKKEGKDRGQDRKEQPPLGRERVGKEVGPAEGSAGAPWQLWWGGAKDFPAKRAGGGLEQRTQAMEAGQGEKGSLCQGQRFCPLSSAGGAGLQRGRGDGERQGEGVLPEAGVHDKNTAKKFAGATGEEPWRRQGWRGLGLATWRGGRGYE